MLPKARVLYLSVEKQRRKNARGKDQSHEPHCGQLVFGALVERGRCQELPSVDVVLSALSSEVQPSFSKPGQIPLDIG